MLRKLLLATLLLLALTGLGAAAVAVVRHRGGPAHVPGSDQSWPPVPRAPGHATPV